MPNPTAWMGRAGSQKGPDGALCPAVGRTDNEGHARGESYPRRIHAAGPGRNRQGDVADAQGNGDDRGDGRHHDDAAGGLLPRRGFGVRRDRQGPAAARAVTALAPPIALRTPMSRWYIIHAYSGFEGKVRDSILSEATRLGLDHAVEAIEVPTENVTEVRRGKKVQSERKFMPGYVLAKLDLSDQVYHLVKNTPKVTGFLGSSGKPQAISEAEATRMLNSKEEAAASPAKTKIKVDFEIGDSVKVLDGPFASFNGVVEELDFDKSKVKVSVSIFGRATPVELDFEQVERSK